MPDTDYEYILDKIERRENFEFENNVLGSPAIFDLKSCIQDIICTALYVVIFGRNNCCYSCNCLHGINTITIYLEYIQFL